VETATANLQTQSNKQRKRHRARTKANQTKIQTKHTDNSVPLSPNIVWALVPAVASALKNAVPTVKPIKKPRLLRQLKTLNQITSYEGLKLFKLKNPFHFNLSLSTLQRCCFSNWLLLS
jgi:hypothetical protein